MSWKSEKNAFIILHLKLPLKILSFQHSIKVHAFSYNLKKKEINKKKLLKVTKPLTCFLHFNFCPSAQYATKGLTHITNFHFLGMGHALQDCHRTYTFKPFYVCIKKKISKGRQW